MTLATRPVSTMKRRTLSLSLLAAALLGSSVFGGATTASAQFRSEFIPDAPKPPKAKPPRAAPKPAVQGARTGDPVADRLNAKSDPNARMLMEAKELVYDYDTEVVTAVGSVDIYYDGRAVQADRVAYDQKKNRVRATGNVKLTEADGTIVYGESLDLTDDFRDGFVQSLRVETTERTRLAAARGTRTEGKLSVFDRAVYTACEPCRENPAKPPLWQIKAKRIIWREDEKTVYYEDATFELFGQPIAWLPMFWHPDPTVKRKSGWLAPSYVSSSELGVGAEIPYFWVIAPNMDATLSPVITSKQGVLLKGEFRHQLMHGAYSIRAAGIYQADPNEFDDKVSRSNRRDPGLTVGPGDQRERWAVSTTGKFDINDKWSWGWDLNFLSDKWVRDDYDLWGSGSEAISQAFLSGQGDRSWFDLRGYYFYGLTRYDQQDRLPIVAPVLDYNYVFEKPVLGGELAFNINAASLYREDSDFARRRARLEPPTDSVLIGAAGTYSRISGDAQWRRRFVDPIGQVWTPFAFVRGDLIYTKPDNDPKIDQFLHHDQDMLVRGMAGVGLEYRYPFVAVNALGTHQVEPIAQIILRPNESQIGRLPNEDAQSLLFNETSLFNWDKFTGFDRIEGGSRANVGAQYTLTTTSGASFSVMGGQSYHLFGKNSFAASLRDPTHTGLQSGLESGRSDYVAGFTAIPVENFALATHFRLDEDSLSLRSAEVEGRATLGRFQANLAYGRYDEQPKLGFNEIREGVLGGARVFLNDDLYVGGGARYNFDLKEFDKTQIGFGLNNIEDCINIAFDYIREYDANRDTDRDDKIDHKFLVKIEFRTLGDVSVSTSSTTRTDNAFGSETSRYGMP
jgi:LPS-assembly protein